MESEAQIEFQKASGDSVAVSNGLAKAKLENGKNEKHEEQPVITIPLNTQSAGGDSLQMVQVISYKLNILKIFFKLRNTKYF